MSDRLVNYADYDQGWRDGYKEGRGEYMKALKRGRAQAMDEAIKLYKRCENTTSGCKYSLEDNINCIECICRKVKEKEK